jgi:hypothetical protein
MNKTVISKVIGELEQDENFPNSWRADNIAIPFFDNLKLSVTFEDYSPEADRSFLQEADQALVAFLNKGSQDRLEISDLVYKNFHLIRNEVDFPYWSEALKRIERPIEIWRFIRPFGISITRRPYEERDIYINISCKCEWEEEHGLQLVFRKGKKLTRVSQIDGHLTDADAYNIPDDRDELLSKF